MTPDEVDRMIELGRRRVRTLREHVEYWSLRSRESEARSWGYKGEGDAANAAYQLGRAHEAAFMARDLQHSISTCGAARLLVRALFHR